MFLDDFQRQPLRFRGAVPSVLAYACREQLVLVDGDGRSQDRDLSRT
jgi:hypothetical protein